MLHGTLAVYPKEDTMTQRPPIHSKVDVLDFPPGTTSRKPIRTTGTVRRYVGRETVEIELADGRRALYHPDGMKEANP